MPPFCSVCARKRRAENEHRNLGALRPAPSPLPARRRRDCSCSRYVRQNGPVKSEDEVIADTLASHYEIRAYHPEFRDRFGDRFAYALPSMRAGFSRINPNGADPREYVVFAASDARRGGAQGLINALGNAKRAVHLSVESLVQLYCLSRYARKRGFPGLLQLLQKLEAFPTQLMAVLNRRRNEVEHEYATPSESETTEFVEMAELFVGLCYRFFSGAVVGAYVGEVGTQVCREYRIDPQAYAVAVFDVNEPMHLSTPDGPIHYNMKRTTARSPVTSIPLDAEHEDQWAPIISLFAHCTNSDTYRLHELGRPGEIVPTICDLEFSSERDAFGRTVVRTTHETYAPTGSR